MVGVGKLMKQMQKMKTQMEDLQAEVAQKEMEVSSGGGAVTVKIMGSGEFKSLTIDPEFLKEDKVFVEETILSAIQEAAQKAKAFSEEKMGSLTSGLNIPGLM